MKQILLILLLVRGVDAFAWAGRGHHAICSAAVQLVKEKGLREFLKYRPQVMGHLCNVPDIYWKALPPADVPFGGASHYVNPEVLGLKAADIPASYAQLEKEFTGHPNAYRPDAVLKSLPADFGSSWWRANQFFRRVTDRREAFSKVVPPKGRAQEQDPDFAFNLEVYNMMVNLGLMGHFVGDASQPLHNTADHDGIDEGHAGLHYYYEEVAPAEAGANFEGEIAARARLYKNQAWMDPKRDVIERMRAMTVTSLSEIPRLIKLDPLTKKSPLPAKHGETVPYAEREPGSVGWKRYHRMIIADMARSSLLLAQLWDEAYVALGRPEISGYRSYRYPFTPPFIPLDYIAAPVVPAAAPGK